MCLLTEMWPHTKEPNHHQEDVLVTNLSMASSILWLWSDSTRVPPLVASPALPGGPLGLRWELREANLLLLYAKHGKCLSEVLMWMVLHALVMKTKPKRTRLGGFAKILFLCWISSCIWYCFDPFFFSFFLSLTKNMCNFLSETPVLECAEQIFYKRGKVQLRVILLSSDFLELRAKTGNSPKELLHCLKECKSHTPHTEQSTGAWGQGWEQNFASQIKISHMFVSAISFIKTR